MLKFSLVYLAGALTVAAAVVGTSAVIFGLGILAAVLIQVAARRVMGRGCTVASHTQRAKSKVTKSQPPAPSRVERDLASALVNFGARKPDATAAARYAVQSHPAADFNTLFRAALSKAAA